MKNKKPEITVKLIKECFDYADGKVFWKKRPLSHFRNEVTQRKWNTRHSGKEAGGKYKHKLGKERWQVRINRFHIQRYHIVWAIHKNEYRTNLDHKDRNSLNDDIKNLRPCNHSQNAANTEVRKINSSGFKGAFYVKKSGKWFSRIRVNGENKYLGCFNTPEEANQAYIKAAKEYHGEFACGG